EKTDPPLHPHFPKGPCLTSPPDPHHPPPRPPQKKGPPPDPPPFAGQMRLQLAQRLLDIAKQPPLVVKELPWQRFSCRQTVLEQGAPAHPVGYRKGEIRRPEPDKPVHRSRFLGCLRDLLGGGEVALERGKCAGIHRDDKVIKVGHHIVNRADRTADLESERPSLQAAQAVVLDGPLGGGNQCVSEPLPAFGSLGHGALTEMCERCSI